MTTYAAPTRFCHLACMGLALAFLSGLSCAADSRGMAEVVAPTAPTSIHWEKYSDDIFARAKAEHRLVLLDLEAVWCHWCHVQDEITYRDPKVMDLINSHYIAVKVDQDSRPDLSNRYEDFGWPATIVLDAGGGDLVKRSGYIPPGPMAAMLQAVVDDPTPGPSVQPDRKVEFRSETGLSPELRKELEARLVSTYDGKAGGWGTIHKFVDWDSVEYSLVQARAGDADAEHRARQTLDAGLKLIDPAWGGVYQYSTDGDWDHPHFEKLMQFQAEMLRIYALADARFHEPRYVRAAAAIRAYIKNFLTSPDGAFYVSQDADLVEGEHSAGYFAMDDLSRRKLGVPRVDTHVYARENGCAIRGILAGYCHTQDPADLQAAVTAANWVIAHRSLPGGGFRHDEADSAGPYLGDALAMGRAFLALYEATADRAWLTRAESAAAYIGATFRPHQAASDSAGFLTTIDPPAGVSFHPRPQLDENAAAARFFNLLNRYSGRSADHQMALEAMRFLAAPQIARSRTLFIGGLLLADHDLATEPLHVTIVGPKNDPAAQALFMQALKSPAGYRRIEWHDRSEAPLPNADVEYPESDQPAAFVCTGNACSSPITDMQKLAKRLGF